MKTLILCLALILLTTIVSATDFTLGDAGESSAMQTKFEAIEHNKALASQQSEPADTRWIVGGLVGIMLILKWYFDKK